MCLPSSLLRALPRSFITPPPVLGVFDIFERYFGYALGVNLVGIDMLAEAQGREDAYLAAGVEAENVCRGVALGIAVVLARA